MTPKLSLAGVACMSMLLFGCSNQRTDNPTVSKTGGDITTAPAGNDAAKRDIALVRFINADPQNETVDLWFGDTKPFSGVAYRTATGYQELPAATHQFKLYRTGESLPAQAAATNGEVLFAGNRYTIVLVRGPDGKQMLNAFSDKIEAPDAGKAKVRVFNAASATKEIAVTQGSEKLFDGVDFNSVTNYKEVAAPMSTVVQVKPEGKSSPMTTIPATNFAPDKLYTVVVMEAPSGKLEQVVVTDQLL